MNILSKLKGCTRHGAMLGAITVAMLGAALIVGRPATANASASDFNCDSNAVIVCGAETSNQTASAQEITSRYNNGSSYGSIHDSASSIHNIYDWFNISSSDIQNLSKDAQIGSVDKNGNVYIGSKLVATDASTAGREFISNSNGTSIRHDSNGTIFYTRKPSVSFASDSLSAYVVTGSNGQFKFAILEACGNAVSGTPTPTPKPKPVPSYTINKEVAVKGSSDYSKSVNVKAGTHVVYRITVTSTGNTPVTNLDVSDMLPSDVQYVPGTLKQDNNEVSTSFFASGVKIASLKNGTSTVFTFEAIVGPNDTPESCSAETLNNIGHMTATSLPEESSTATVNMSCQPCPQPVYACTSLTSEENSYDEFTFNAKASASNGAVITGYTFNFGDGKTQTVSTAADSATAQHTYADSGTYNATVAAIVQVNGATKTVTSTNCATTVKVTCPQPVYACTSLTSEENSYDEFTFNAKASASNGAVITGYTFNFGDGKTQTVSTAADSATAQHTYADSGTYNATVAAIVQVNGATKTVTSTNCATTVKVCPPPAAECTDLKLIQNTTNPREVTATVTYTATNGATLSGISYNWGDSTTTPASTNTSATHTYQADGTYTVNATATFSSTNGTVPASNCQAPITITTVTPTCDELDIDVNNTSKTVTITNLAYTANDGAYEFTTVDWGDGSAQTTAADVIGQTHTYAANGPFTVIATTHFTVNGTDSGVTSTSCQQPVSFTTETTPPPVTPPTQLVNTGAGNVVGLFAGATVLGVAGYHWFLRRRMSHES